MVSTFSSVVRRENIIGLWKGISPVSAAALLFLAQGFTHCLLFVVSKQVCTQYWCLLLNTPPPQVNLWVRMIHCVLGVGRCDVAYAV